MAAFDHQASNSSNSKKHQILFTHYMKPMTSKYVINKRSALSTTMKKSVLVSDLVRTMRNVSLQCPESERQKHVQNFIKRMQFSGYDQQERIKVYTTAKRKYEQIIEKDRKGECPMYRGKLWQRERREKAKIKKKRTWYEKGGYETVLFVDATPNEELARECQRIVNQSELKIKVIEKAGKSLKESLVLSDPFKNKTCEDNDCKVCKHDPKANCKALNRKMDDDEDAPGNEDGPGCVSVYHHMWHTLRIKYGLIIPRRSVESMLKTVDPVGAEERKQRRLKRRAYTTKLQFIIAISMPTVIWSLSGVSSFIGKSGEKIVAYCLAYRIFIIVHFSI
eukprot:gene10730-11877_t